MDDQVDVIQSDTQSDLACKYKNKTT